MITKDDIKEISRKIALENGMPSDTLSEDISEIVYRMDALECGDSPIIDRHIDIEYSFGDYYEVREDSPTFQFIGSLCNLPTHPQEAEIVLYQADETED